MNKIVICSLCLLPMVVQAKDVRISSNVMAELSEDGKIIGKMPLIVSVQEKSNYEIVVDGKTYHLDLNHQRGRSGGLTSSTTEETICEPTTEATSTSIKSSSKGTTKGTTSTSSSSSDDEDDKKEEKVVALQYTPTDYYINVSQGNVDLKSKEFILAQYSDLKFGNDETLMTLSSMTSISKNHLSDLLKNTISADEAATIIGK